MIDSDLLHGLGYEDLRSAGKESIALEIMGAIGACRERIEALEAGCESFEELERRYHAEGKEDFDLDDRCLAWRAAREQLDYWRKQLKKLRVDVA